MKMELWYSKTFADSKSGPKRLVYNDTCVQ